MHTCHYRNELVAAVHECTKCRLKSNHEIAGVSPAPLALLSLPLLCFAFSIPLETARPREAVVARITCVHQQTLLKRVVNSQRIIWIGNLEINLHAHYPEYIRSN